MKEKEVFERMLEPLADNNPFAMSTPKATVIVAAVKEAEKMPKSKSQSVG